MPISSREAEPSVGPETPDTAQAERFGSFRLAGASLGTLLLIVGLALVIAIFFEVYRFIRDPKELKGYIDRWEVVVRGNIPVFGEAKEDAAAPEPESDDPDARQMHLGGRGAQPQQPATQDVSIARPMMEMMALSARPLAIVVLLFLAGILVKIATVIVDVGARLMHLTVSEQGLLKRLIEEIRRK